MKSTISKWFLLLFVWSLFACQQKEAPVRALSTSTPEKEGVSAQGILDFLDAAGKSNTEFHSFVFLRHGKIIAEGWWSPYRTDLRHTLYSTSKSFTSTAVGLAIADKHLNLDDKVVSFFPGDLPEPVSPNLADMKVSDLLSMSAGQDPDPTASIVGKDSNWVRAFLALPVVNHPGTKFLYNSMASYMLSAIVQKVTGQKELDYLTPRLFEPLDIRGMDWETDARGINTGGWGLRLKTEDMAKFGQLYLQNGKWGDRQVLPSDWVKEATTFKIDQAPDAPQSKKDSSDWMQGYCYQFWRCRHQAFRADGAFGQYILVMPEEDAVIAITAESPNMQSELNLVWDNLLPAMHPEPLPDDPHADSLLARKLSGLALPLPQGDSTSITAGRISGKTFVLKSNPRQIKTLSFTFTGKQCSVNMQTDTAVFDLGFLAGGWTEGQTKRPGPNLLYGAIGHFASLSGYMIAGSYAWKDANTLELILRYIESPHHEEITCHFNGDRLTVDMEKSQDFGSQSVELTGTLLKK